MEDIRNVRYVIKSNDMYYDARYEGIKKEIGDASLFHSFDDACFIANKLNTEDECKYTAHKVMVTYEIDG